MGSCSPYQKVLKQDDIKPKYDLAVKMYEEGVAQEKNGKLKKSLTLSEQILPKYRGKPQGEKIAYIYADAYYQLEDYFDSGYQFERFTKTYPNSEKTEEAYYKGAKSYFEVSPRFSLDQVESFKALTKFQEYITRYPDGEFIGEANGYVGQLRDKIEKKAFLIAKGYHLRENYKAGIAAMDNFIKDYPGSKYMERAYFYKFDSAYLLAIDSYRQLVKERLNTAEEYYDDYRKYYDDGEYSGEASIISEDIETRLQNI